MTGVFCEICGQLDDRCNAYAHRMADRIAKLEAHAERMESFMRGPTESPPVSPERVAELAAEVRAAYKEAETETLEMAAELNARDKRRAAKPESAADETCHYGHCAGTEDGECTGPPAPAQGAPTRFGPADCQRRVTHTHELDNGREVFCEGAKETARSAPCEPLSTRIRAQVPAAQGAYAGMKVRPGELEKLADEIAALEARLAAAERELGHWKQARENAMKACEIIMEERDAALAQVREAQQRNSAHVANLEAAQRERDEAIAAERERCLAFVKPMNRQVILDLMVKYLQGSPESHACSALYSQMYTAEEAIRDGRPIPK